MGLFSHKKRSSKPTPSSSSSPQSTPSTSRPATITAHPNTSTSNLSTTSTLLNAPVKPTSQRPNLAPRQTSYEAFLHHARLDAERSAAVQQQQAWKEAEKRRQMGSGRPWPEDPWRGGFGPPAAAASSNTERVCRGNTGREVWGVSASQVGRADVGEWLRGNGLSRR